MAEVKSEIVIPLVRRWDDRGLPAWRNSAIRVNLYQSDLSLVDRCAARRQYRTLRLAMYAPQRSAYAHIGMYQGCYGHERNGAKEIISSFYKTLSWLTYLGTK